VSAAETKRIRQGGPTARRAGVVLVALGLVTLVGCQSGIGPDPERPRATIAAYETEVATLQDRVDEQDATIASLTPPPATPTAPAFGERWRVEVVGPVTLEAEVGRREALTPIAAEGVFLVVPIEVTNLSDRPLAFAATNRLQIVDGEGRIYDVDPRATGAAYLLDLDLEASFEPRQPGIVYPDVVVFDVPADADDLSLEATDGSFYAPLEPASNGTPAP